MFQGHDKLTDSPCRLNGFFLGVKTLVPWSEWVPEDLQTEDFGSPSMPGHYEPSPSGTPVKRDSYAQLPLTPKLFSPYPDYKSSAYLANHSAVHTCYLDEEETQAAPDIFVYVSHTHLPFPSYC